MFNIQNRLFIRKEKNGITVYDNILSRFRFYESLTVDHLKNFTTIAEVEDFLDKNIALKNRNIEFTAPLKVNWLVQESCNLDCIYCFAHDKFKVNNNKKDILSTAKHITDLNIICVGLTGGEPTMNKYLPQIIDIFNSKCGICIDTNGTIPLSNVLLKKLQESNVLVRITLDSVNQDLLYTLRPEKNQRKDSLTNIINNLSSLKKYGVNVLIETVLTQKNISFLDDVEKTIIKLGFKRWHLYGVNKCKKCLNIYESIKVSNDEIRKVYHSLSDKYGEQIDISVTCDEKTSTANAVILIDSDGNWMVDSMIDGVHKIGKNPKQPSLDEIQQCLNVNLHYFGYLKSKDDIM